jgi:hypothetical protein
MSKTKLHRLRVKIHMRVVKSQFLEGKLQTVSNFLTVPEAVSAREKPKIVVFAKNERGENGKNKFMGG